MCRFLRWQDEDILLDCYIQPGAKKDEISGLFNERLKIRITAPPVDNKANRHLLRFVAKLFGVSPSRVSLLKGDTQRNKRLLVSGAKHIPPVIQSLLDDNAN